jgi:hypothetical protein
VPLAKKTAKAKGNQGAQWSRGSGDGANVNYRPQAGAVDQNPTPRRTGNKGEKIARTGK